MARMTLEMMATIFISLECANISRWWSRTVAAPEPPAGTSQYREGRVIEDANGSVQANDDADNKEARRDNAKSVLVTQSNGQYGGCELPCCRIEGIAEPVSD